MSAANSALGTENEHLSARCSKLQANNDELHARVIKIASDNDSISYRLESLQADNEQLANENQKLALRCEILEDGKQTLNDENAALRSQIESLTLEKQTHHSEAEELKQRILLLEKQLSNQKIEATVPFSNTLATSAAASGDGLQLSKEQMDDILAKLMGSYANIQSQAKDQAAKEYQQIVDFQIDCQKKLVDRIESLESARESASEGNDLQVESIQSEINREVADKIKAIETSMYILQPQCNRVIDDVETISSRLTAHEEQIKELIAVKDQQKSTGSIQERPNSDSKVALAPDDEYNQSVQFKKIDKRLVSSWSQSFLNVTNRGPQEKLKSFMDRTEHRRRYEQQIHEAQTKDELKARFKELSKAIDSNGWDLGPFVGLMPADMHALRDLVVLRYNGLDTIDRSFMELKVSTMKQ